MAEFLSQAWLDVVRDETVGLPAAPIGPLRVQLVVPGGPAGEAKVAATVTDGRVTEATAEADAEAGLTLTVKYADAKALLAGELDPNAAFMQGRIKVVGPTGPLLDLLALARTAPRAEARAAVAARTEF